MTDAVDGAAGDLVAPRSCGELFLVFSRLALQGFGGVLPVAQYHLVERQRWLSREDFVEQLAVAQLLPGPNVVNLSLMVGDRFFGLRGALSALAGMLLAPMAVVLLLASLYGRYAALPAVAGALRGMGAVSAGLVLATAWKLAPALRRNPLGAWGCALFALAAFGFVALLRWPLVEVLPALGLAACGLAWHRLGADGA